MPSHFSTVGIAVTDEQSLVDLAMRTVEEGERHGDYVRWEPSPGVELWAQVQGDALIGLNPHFAGAGRMEVAITAEIEADDATPLDGTLHAWADPEDPAEPESGLFPFVFDVPDRRVLGLPALPAAASVQLALFAHHFEWHPDEAAFEGVQEEPRFAPESFFPSGMFGDDPPSPDALMHGRLLDGGHRRNEHTGTEFWAGRVRTLGGEIDVVADRTLVDGAPPAGAILQAGGWLSGRVRDARPYGSG